MGSERGQRERAEGIEAMPKFLKGNYPLKGKAITTTGKRQKSLTDRMEAGALAKLGGSMCFVMKKKTFLWMEEQGEQPGQGAA